MTAVRRAGRTGAASRAALSPVVLLSVVLVALGTATLGGAGTAAAASAPAGPGTVAVSPATASASSGGNTLRLTYTAPGTGVRGGAVAVRIPRGWTRPQHRHPAYAGYVATSGGALRISGRTVVVGSLSLCGGCSVTITVADARAPSPGRSVFVTRSVASTGGRLRPLGVQPGVTVVGGASSAVPLGDYAGWADPDGVAAFARDTGTDPTMALDYLDSGNGWAAMDGAGGMGAWSGSGYRLVLGVPIIPTDAGGTPQGTLAGGATGAYDGYFTTLAQNLVRQGLSGAVLRLGWEFNGSWYAWSVQSATDAADFAAYWRQIVATMRAVPGARFQFFWNPNAPSPTSYSPSAAYPGDAYVDYVGTDAYDSFWGTPFTPQAAWAGQLSQQWGLDWLASFAAAHGKAIAVGEWSCQTRPDGHGLGDDPYYVNQMAAWIGSHDVAFTDVFSFDTSSTFRDDLLDGTFPNALAAFERDFG